MLVSAVMPTTPSRRAFQERAVACFLAQTYEDAELVILDEGPDEGRHGRDIIRHFYVAPGMSTGAKRNAVNELARGEVLVHWDDDDWSHPERIERQVRLLEETGQQMVGYHDLLYYRPADRTLWCYYFQGDKPYATGTSMMYRKAWWERHRFPDRRWAEDTALWHEARGERALASTGKELGFGNIHMIVARAHPGNTYHPQFGKEPFVGADRGMFPQEFLTEEGL